MSVTVSKGKIFSVYVEVDDARLEAMKKSPKLAAEAVQRGADYWHRGILPEHFLQPARGKYGYAPRSPNYLRNRDKGFKPDLVLKGSLRHDLKAKAAFEMSDGGINVTLRMQARVLNLAPNMSQDNQDLYVKHKNGRGYPNLKREIKVILEDEREAVAQVIAAELARSFDPSHIATEQVQAALNASGAGI